MSLMEHTDGAATLTHERLTVCFESFWELEALAMALPGLVPTDAHTNAHFLVRATAGRIKQLTSVLMARLGDSMEKTSDLQCTLLVTHKAATT